MITAFENAKSNEKSNDERWLSLKEFAAQIGVSPRTVRRWIAAQNPKLEVDRFNQRLIRVRRRISDDRPQVAATVSREDSGSSASSTEDF